TGYSGTDPRGLIGNRQGSHHTPASPLTAPHPVSMLYPMRPLLLACAVLLLAAPALSPQEPVNAALGWKTITTPHFRIHFEPGLEAWSESLAGRIEQMREIV